MFEDLKRVANNVRRLDAHRILQKIFDDADMKLDVVSLNIGQMFEDGVDSKGVSLGEYSPFTVVLKEKKGQRTDHITLKDTGEFYDSIDVTSEPNQIIITGDTRKPDVDLAVVYPDALGLTNENIEAIQGLVLPIFQEEVRRAIQA